MKPYRHHRHRATHHSDRRHALSLGVGETVSIGASVGVALASGNEAVDDFIGRADNALYEAKQAGKGIYRVSLSKQATRFSAPHVVNAGEEQTQSIAFRPTT
ncbi:diguanylate cyclase domain-containing protein [Paraburkholderia diazotrophica]|uniref:diguanylate cyclase domain-containing protein n=1 Tax=Paraburkholderia diazotrophica TaxID=667676 RepID=UPI002481EB3E|nr:diguanylate cyclase [Paraburkholderia diazotrophica]